MLVYPTINQAFFVYGISHGSVLGLLLFILYINDMTNALHTARKCFAEDACLFLSSNTIISKKKNIYTV